MIKVYFRIVVSAWKNFGFSTTFWGWLLITPLFIAFSHFSLWLDNLFFPKYRECQVKNPIFIVGHPRSGNTFLHKLLTQTDEFLAFKTWQIILPSLTARTLLKPLINYLINNQKSGLVPETVGHSIALDKVEEEEFLFFHKLDTQFVWARSPLGFDDEEHPEFRFHDQQPDSRRKTSIKFFQGCLQRQIYQTGKKQAILQTLQSVHRIKTILETFPDAKFIYLIRSPYETIPSHLSVLWFWLDHQTGVNKIAPDKLKQYFQKRYRYNIDLYRYFDDLQKNGDIPTNNLLVVEYNELRSNLEVAFQKIVDFTGIKPSEGLQIAVQQQAQKQHKYQRKHEVIELEKFDLTNEKIAQDFSFVLEKYGFKREVKN